MMKTCNRRPRLFALALSSVAACALVALPAPGQDETERAVAETAPPVDVPAPVRAEIPLPPGLSDELLSPAPGSPAEAQLDAPLAEALAEFAAATFDEVEPADALVPAAERAADDAIALLGEGRSFEAIQRLREAERLAPDHPRVVRALGLAFVRGGNHVRGEAYLRRAAAMDRADVDVRVVLARLALDRKRWNQAAGLSLAIDEANTLADTPDPAAPMFAKYIRAAVLDGLEYPFAAIMLYEEVLASDIEPAPASAAGQEWYILRQQADTMRLRVGDLYLRRGERERALQQYQQIDAARLMDPNALATRLAYTHLLLDQSEDAALAVVGFIASPLSAHEDRELVAYLVQQGADPATLDALLVAAAIDAPTSHFPIVAARSVLLPQAQTVALIDAWLAEQPPTLSAFRKGIALLRGNTEDGDDPIALAHALALAAQAMERQPQRGVDYANALLDQPIDPVALIRALRRPEIDQTSGITSQLLNALAYDKVGRAEDAYTMYARILDQQPDHAEARLGIVSALLVLGPRDPSRFEEAEQWLGEVSASAEWERFTQQVDLFSATGQVREANLLVRNRLRLEGPTLDLLLLRLGLTLQTEDDERAVPLATQLLQAFPTDERAYTAASRLVMRLDKGETRQLAEVFEASLRGMLEMHLPESKAAAFQEAYWLFRYQMRPGLAAQVLGPLLEAYPNDTDALGISWVVYSALGEQGVSDALKLRWIQSYSADVWQAMELADYYTERAPERAAQVVRETMALSQEGVLPGPTMTGADAASLLHTLTLVVGDAASEPDYLRAIRRFPRSPNLNNGLGYRWAVAGKELLAAEVMVQRAHDASELDVSSYLDSMGWVYYKMGRFAEAEAMLRRAISQQREEHRQLNITDPASKAVLYDHLGDILYQQGETASAMRHWHIAKEQRIPPEDAAQDPEAATVNERCEAKVAALRDGREAPVSEVPGEAAFGSGVHPAERAQ